MSSIREIVPHVLLYGCVLMGAVFVTGFLRFDGRFDPPRQGKDAPVDVRKPISVAPGPVASLDGPPAADAGLAVWRADDSRLKRPITMQTSSVSLGAAIVQIAKQAGLDLACLDTSFDARRPGRLSVHLTRVPAWSAMQAVAAVSGSTWQREHDLYILRPSPVKAARVRMGAALRFRSLGPDRRSA